jgi:hypothetical protein
LENDSFVVFVFFGFVGVLYFLKKMVLHKSHKTKKTKKQSFSKLVWARFGFRLVWKKIVFLFFCFFGFVGVLHFVEKDWFCTILTMSFVGGKACLW